MGGEREQRRGGYVKGEVAHHVKVLDPPLEIPHMLLWCPASSCNICPQTLFPLIWGYMDMQIDMKH
jgi:hypothetical protein